ncbi:F-box/LRR-repeat protein 6 [Mantella aurantiaca]
MLLLISSNRDLDESVSVRKRCRVMEPIDQEITEDYGWGSIIPPEILHQLFQILADTEGAVPTLCRLSRVCRLWRQVASSPDLWHRVTLSRCWVLPGTRDPPRTQRKVAQTVETLIQQRLPQVSEFSLHQWKSCVSLVLQNLSQFCPLLTSLTVSHCSQVTLDDLLSVGRCCPQLQSLSLQNSKMQPIALQKFLEMFGERILRLRLSYTPQINSIMSGIGINSIMSGIGVCPPYYTPHHIPLRLSYTPQINSIMSGIGGGWCPELRLLEVDLPFDSVIMDLQFPIEGLQEACPKLEVLRLLNISWQAIPAPRLSARSAGFPDLQELCLATSRYSSVTDAVCLRLLKGSSKLRVLDLRGCYKISPQGLRDLPCNDLDHLFLGLYCSSAVSSSMISGSHLLTRKWRHSLQELDLTGQVYGEDDLAEALRNLCGPAGNDTLRSLNLSGTKATPLAVRDLLLGCQALAHLDLTSCRSVPRGLKRVYRSREDILLCLQDLTDKLQEAQHQ